MTRSSSSSEAALENDSAPIVAKPFLKWAGGKSQLLDTIERHLPQAVHSGTIKKYFDPMVGGGAVFFYLAQKFRFESLHISDVNEELILAYSTIQRDVKKLISELKEIEHHYHALDDSGQEKYFYKMRVLFNDNKGRVKLLKFHRSWLERTAQIIFLNKTCFNGLFRVNAKGLFNVPFGRYKNPTICAAGNLSAVAELLRKTEIRHADFASYLNEIDDQSFIYFDPPYRPLSKTASFTAYAGGFGDNEQLRLSKFFRTLHEKGALVMLSNSDPKNTNPGDNFFDDAYTGFVIKRVPAIRMINSKAEKRGAIDELLIMNYQCQGTR